MQRSRVSPLRALLSLGLLLGMALSSARADEPTVERWGIFEVALDGPSDGNPFTEVTLSARFQHGDEVTEVSGFYDGEGVYRVRFLPGKLGTYRYETRSNRAELDGKAGRFEVGPPGPKDHGPVGVRDLFHFAYADGTPHFSFGTTCYAWTHQGDALEEQTLATLAGSPFNKIRMCVFPKNYTYNKNEPVYYPFAGSPPRDWDLERFNPAFFRHLELRIGQLRDLGIEADLILFHPYDKGRWGFDRMPAEADDRYLRYVIARLAAYRNVWWSLANEFDFMEEKTDADWDRYFRIVREADPYHHLRSIHNGTRLYNQNESWVTHASVQNGSAVEESGRAILYRDAYRKPIVFDEVKYEGDIPQRWGNLSAEELVLRFWQGTIAGTYVGHGETYLHPEDDVLWWSKGGILRGEGPARIAFLREVVEDGPPGGIEPIDKWQEIQAGGKIGEYYLIHLGRQAPKSWPFRLPRTKLDGPLRVHVDLIDTWEMTIAPLGETYTLKPLDDYTLACDELAAIPLPGKPYMAIRVRKAP